MPTHPGPDRGPSALLPLAYLVCAAAGFLAAALGVVWLAPELAGHYYHPRILALTHTVTLGWITLAIMGASYQIVPVALERPIWSERLARWQLGVLAVAVTGMVAHFYLGTWHGLAAAASLLAVGVALHLVNVGLSLRGLAQWTFTARLVALGYGGLAATTLFGLALAADRLWPVLPGGVFPRLHAHVQLALLGWVAPMILGVTARVYPMFFLAPAPGRGSTLVQLYGLAVAVPAVVTGLLGAPGLLPIGAVAASAALATHAWWVIGAARARKRPGLDWGLRFALTATTFLAPAVALGLALGTDRLSGPRAALAYAVVVLGGWVSLTIAGVMLKIVPFLVWYRVFGPRAGREPVPTLAQLASPRLEGLAYVLLVGGVLLLAMAVFAGEPTWIRGAGVILASGALAFTSALARILAHLTRRARLRVPAAPGPSEVSPRRGRGELTTVQGGTTVTCRSIASR